MEFGQPDDQVDLPAMRRIDALCDRFTGDWKQGRTPRIEDYIAACAESDRPHLLRELVEIDRHYRTNSAASGFTEDYAARFPELINAAETLPLDAATMRKQGQQLRDVVGRFRLLGRLGQGGMGVVWEAEELDTGRRVALKMVACRPPLSDDSVNRFLREGRLAASLSHPRSAFVIEANRHQGQPYLVMELMPGRTLKDMVAEQGPLPASRAVEYMLDVIDGLEAAHRLGIVHRDVKPANCFIDGDGRVKVGDYGLAQALDDPAEQTPKGVFVGTPSYAPPEQIRGEAVDHRSDQYSVGATLFYLLTGRPPFTGELMAVVAQTAADPAPLLSKLVPGLPYGLDRIVARCLDKDPRRRYRDLSELRRALTPFSTSGTTLAHFGRRMAAYAIDEVLAMATVTICSVPLSLIAWWVMNRQLLTDPSGFVAFLRGNQLLLAFAFLLLEASYFVIAEGLFGAGVGKRFVGLRVATADGGPPGLWRSAVRVFFIPGAMGVSLLDPLAVWIQGSHQAVSEVQFHPVRQILIPFLVGGMSYVPLGLCLTSMRRGNGYRGWHDLASGTQVVSIRHHAGAASIWKTSLKDGPVIAQTTSTTAWGPFRTIRVLDSCDHTALVEAHDELLHRHVWIYLRHADSPPLPTVRQHAARPTRLRWLQSGIVNQQRWDAFEAAEGGLLCDLLADRQPSWEAVRVLLTDWADELSAALADKSLPDPLSLQHFWVDQRGRGKLLDLPRRSSCGHDCEGQYEGESRGWAAFRGAVEACKQEQSWPSYAQQFRDEVMRKDQTPESLRWARDRLREMADKPGTLHWDDRLGLLCISAAGGGWIVAFCTIFVGVLLSRMSALDSGARFAVHVAICTLLPAIPAMTCRGSPVFRLFGIAVRRRDGGPAGRLRCGWRDLLAWLPWTLPWAMTAWAVGVAAVVSADLPVGSDALGLMRPPLIYFFFCGGIFPAMLLPLGAAWAATHPTCGIQDRIAGTRLIYE